MKENEKPVGARPYATSRRMELGEELRNRNGSMHTDLDLKELNLVYRPRYRLAQSDNHVHCRGCALYTVYTY